MGNSNPSPLNTDTPGCVVMMPVLIIGALCLFPKIIFYVGEYGLALSLILLIAGMITGSEDYEIDGSTTLFFFLCYVIGYFIYSGSNQSLNY